ncbi:MAG: FG-GAP-like repeat-containing protein [Planctomycetota bacterium]
MASPSLGASDVEEKDYIAHDFDKDGDPDVICVRKLPFTTFGDRQNVFFENVFGVLTDRTATLCADFILAFDNSRDVMIGDFDGDTWMDFVVANAGNQASPGQQPRIFFNLGMSGSTWLGFREETNRIPFLATPGGLQPNACAVGVGDVTGNGTDDIYLVDYLNSLEDKLLINDGLGFFTDQTTTRIPAGFEVSAFATAGMIVDVNADGLPDIVKNTTPNVRIAYNNGNGFFTTQQNLAVSAAYHFDVGDLNNDGKNDFFIVQDGQDKWQINNSAPGTIPVTWGDFPVTTSPLTTGFGGNVHLADLDADGYQDVTIVGNDSDVPNCTRETAYLRSNGVTPNPTLADPYTVLEPIHQQGVHDACIADFNGDGALDILVGHCTGTDLWFQVPPTPPILPVDSLTCNQTNLDVQLTWNNPQTYVSVSVRRNGVTLATLSGATASYLDVAPGSGSYSYSVVGNDGTIDSSPVSCVLEVSTVNAPEPVTCVQADVDVQLNWTNQGGITGAPYDFIELLRNGTLLTTLPASTTSYLDLAPPVASTLYELRGVIGIDRSASGTCTINVAATNSTDLVLDFAADDNGATNSARALVDALEANSRVVHHLLLTNVTDLPSLNVDPNDYERVWVELGTSPNNKILNGVEGQILADFVTDGIGGKDLFMSGADTYFFDPQTPVHALLNLTATDGFGSIANVQGLAGATCDLTELPLIPFSGEDTAVDRLVATGSSENIVGANGSAFNVSVFHPQAGGGSIVSQSFETGGLATNHDKKELVRLYLQCMPSGFPAPVAIMSVDVTAGLAPLTVAFTNTSTGFIDTHNWNFGDNISSSSDAPIHTYLNPGTYTVTYTVTGPGGTDTIVATDLITAVDPNAAAIFLRGDANSDLTINVADAVRVLTHLFPSGAPPVIDCFSALDANDDGAIDISDPVRILGYLFGGGGDLAPPFPACGVEVSVDSLTCTNSVCP